MKYIKKYNEDFHTWWNKKFPEITLEELVPLEKIYHEFEERGLSCNPKDNKINDVIYSEDNNKITCTFTSAAYAGELGKDISNKLQKIADAIGADDFDIDAYSNAIFYFDFKTHPELEPKEYDN